MNAADSKTHALVVEREGMPPCYVANMSRAGKVKMTWERSQARRWVEGTAERHAKALNQSGWVRFEAIEVDAP